jgi:cold shock CspA family protein
MTTSRGDPEEPRLRAEASKARLRDVAFIECRGTVLGWKDEKGYGRILADDGYVYFCHFSAIFEADARGYRALRKGQKVEFNWDGSVGAHGRKAASEVRVIGGA